jgi:hypothetical protein
MDTKGVEKVVLSNLSIGAKTIEMLLDNYKLKHFTLSNVRFEVAQGMQLIIESVTRLNSLVLIR